MSESLTEEGRVQVKQKVSVLNSMLKKMIPLYGPQGIRRDEPVKQEHTGTISSTPTNQRTFLVVKEEPSE